MRFYNRQHRHYCGIDLHVKTMYVCMLDTTGQVLVHRNVPSTPEALLQVVAPYREKVPCTIRLVRAPKPSMGFYDFDEYERLLEAAKELGPTARLVALLGGEAGLRCGEIIGLEWSDVWIW